MGCPNFDKNDFWSGVKFQFFGHFGSILKLEVIWGQFSKFAETKQFIKTFNTGSKIPVDYGDGTFCSSVAQRHLIVHRTN